MQTANLRVAIVGAGTDADIHLQGIAASRTTTVVGIFDTDVERAKTVALAAGCGVYDSFEAVLTDANVDGVAVLSPTATHAKYVDRALRAGKHVVCGRPLGVDLSEVRAMVKSARQSTCSLLPAHENLYTEPMLELARLLERDAIGQVTRVEAHARDTHEIRAEGECQPMTDGQIGALAREGYGPIAAMLALGQRPAFLDAMRSTGDANVHLPARAVAEEQMIVIFQMEGGYLAAVTADLSQQVGPAEHTLRFLGTEGELRIRRTEKPGEDAGAPVRREQLVRIDERAMTVVCEEVVPAAAATRMWDDYAESIRRGTTPFTTIEQAVAATSIVDSAHFAAQRGMRVNVRGLVDRQIKGGF